MSAAAIILSALSLALVVLLVLLSRNLRAIDRMLTPRQNAPLIVNTRFGLVE